ncbi:MAG: SsrA-binding protein [candidate division TM6 bacterium GW2011_GWF2_32_72]|nr:MAG: SsrA-binding protein [candidate division TM6 bacterium GW2011_GWF2_32_72]
MKILAQNKKALFDYHILENIEAGIVLTGDEVKSLRAGKANLTGSFATVHQGELFLLNAHISIYSHAFGPQKKDEEATRSRKLLLHKKELHRLMGDISKKGITIIPLKLYFNEKNRVKVDLGIAKHKKMADKRSALREKDIARDTARELKNVRGI